MALKCSSGVPQCNRVTKMPLTTKPLICKETIDNIHTRPAPSVGLPCIACSSLTHLFFRRVAAIRSTAASSRKTRGCTSSSALSSCSSYWTASYSHTALPSPSMLTTSSAIFCGKQVSKILF